MGHGLTYPSDLLAWRRWHESRHAVRGATRAASARIRPGSATVVDLLTSPAASDILVAVEATHASVDRAVVAPLGHLPPANTSIVCPVDWTPPESFSTHARQTVALDRIATLVEPSAVLAAGHYTEIGAAAFAIAEDRDATFYVSQHGALTPFAPPLPRSAHLLAWSEADADFWTAGRHDVQSTVVGSQLLWEAGLRPTSVTEGPLTYLGQGHAAEIPRGRLVHAAFTTCRERGALYRPHPSEGDVASRITLAAYKRAGISVDGRRIPLVELTSPVVSVFSTGVLEAAARGLDAWVDFPRPSAWLLEFWDRYGMSRLGTNPTSAPTHLDRQPAQFAADVLLSETLH